MMRRARVVVAGLCAAALAGCGSSGPVVPPAHSYYLSLGDSLAQGVQADPFGHVGDTDLGYADQLYGMIRRGYRDLGLVKLGCPGETTRSMIRGRHCPYPAGSQLAQAVAFLRDHRGHVPLVTLDIGANDRRSCFTDPVNVAVLPCATGPAAPTAANLALILGRLRAAAGPRTLIIGMTYYAPELPEWRYGPGGRARARASERLTLAFDAELARVYRSAGDRVADVAGAFATADFAGQAPVRGLGMMPPSVAAICRWTWVCARPPRGPNKHPDEAGYTVIARAFLAAYRTAPDMRARAPGG
ncbi:MAG: SGNH/GDSL hydrolase family protein [Streptosporangiaceae bacterium]